MGVFDLRRRAVNTDHCGGRARIRDDAREDAGTAADVEPLHIWRRCEPAEKCVTERPAPAADELLVANSVVKTVRDRCHARPEAKRRSLVNGRSLSRYCASPTAFTSRAFISISFSTSAWNCAGVITIGSTPSEASFCLIFGVCSALSVSS